MSNQDDWKNGLCCVFAYALHERYDLPMKALVVREADGFDSLLHALVSSPGGTLIDASGPLGSSDDLVAQYKARFSEEDLRSITLASGSIEILVRDVTLDELEEMNPEDITDTREAHRFIDENPSLFVGLDRLVVFDDSLTSGP